MQDIKFTSPTTKTAYIQGVTGGLCEASGECSLCQTIPINPKHLYPKLNGYGDNGHRNVWASGVSTYCTPSVKSYLSNAPACQRDMVMQSAHGSSDVTR